MDVNGISYDGRTPDGVINALEYARRTRTRVRVHYGDYPGMKPIHHREGDPGRDWLEEHEVVGYVGQSRGPMKIPLCVCDSRSTGGGGFLTQCIVKIRAARGGAVLYEAPTYHYGRITIETDRPGDDPRWRVHVMRDGEEHAAFADETKAARWLHKMGLAPIKD